MADTMTPEQRHRCMSRIRGRDTKPELLVRRFLWAHGHRYRLCVKSLPGRPDIVMRKWKTVIFVNGCFWHGHDCKAGNHLPATHSDFWRDKRNRNRERDARSHALLRAMGWHVIVLWECQLGTQQRRAQTLRSLDYTLSQLILAQAAPKPYSAAGNADIAAEHTVNYTPKSK